MVVQRVLRYFNKPWRYVFLISVLWMLLWVIPGTGHEAFAQDPMKIQTVVIDPGHGGRDPGAVGKRIHEKDLVLAIALKVGTLIQRNYPDVKVIYTRDRDRFVELHERAAIANRNEADLFISIHANANNARWLRGAETYVMGLHKSQDNLEIAKVENASILLESDYTANYAGFDPNSDESYITFSLYQNANLDLSTQFAAEIQEEMKERVGLTDRGVRQAGFLVLYRTTMPSVLVDIGYLSNAEEEQFMISKNGQDYISSAIYRAFKDYKTIMESGNNASITPVSTSGRPNSSAINSQSHNQSRDSQQEVLFRVQLAASPDKLDTRDPKFRGLQGVYEYYHNGMYKYTWGTAYSFPEVQLLQDRLQGMGFSDAFIVAFKKGKRIGLDEARSLIEK